MGWCIAFLGLMLPKAALLYLLAREEKPTPPKA